MTAMQSTPRFRRALLRRGLPVLALLAVAGLVVFALLRLNLHRVGHVLITASPGWIGLALALMAASLVLRSISWQQTLHAALPDTPVPWAPVVRATMIGVMASAVFPGRIGEPSRVLVLSRRLDGPTRRHLPIVAGTVFSQTLINLLALGILLAVTFTSVPLLHGNVAGVVGALAVPFALCLVVLAGPRLLALARRSRSPRLLRAADFVARMLRLARQGLVVFARPRHGSAAVVAQLLAWALQWLACYCVLLALNLQSDGGLVAAAAILLAVNLSAVLPATPSNVGVFQAACAVVLAAYGVSAGPGVAYGIILQAVEVVTALALGIPALLGEGLRWSDIRSGAGEVSAGESAD
ncbi:MAG TPA: lysylphosphatidylglycerol synthase transmembrane domain-containing protein [Solirubrobacteraceae bacterium]|jgi:phosphatidylinositol alpha-mannosyltransferase|nr:lysylphosphatidylglycerol synthase transmembrane domain-containing protein [Solirubrobacteraceae bacterium]